MQKSPMKGATRRNRRSSFSSSSSDHEEHEFIRKGPWKPEEDQVLLKHVSKYGPRDWSTLLSNGLLHRTGKSCRLRWVNKLRPDLKSGCKFSMEEERIVIDLQSQIGNRWAKIATYLPGRTDNDVKNFWSSRQKRLAKLLHKSKYHNPKSKSSNAIADLVPSSPEVQNQVNVTGESSSNPEAKALLQYTNNASEMIPCGIATEPSSNIEFQPNDHCKTALEEASSPNLEHCERQIKIVLDPQMEFYPDSLSDFELLFPENDEFIRELDMDFMDEFSTKGNFLAGDAIEGLADGDRGGEELSSNIDEKSVSLDCFLDDLPSGVLDQTDLLPGPPPGW